MKQGVPKFRAVRASGVLAPTMGYFLGWAVLIDLFDIAFPSEVLVLVIAPAKESDLFVYDHQFIVHALIDARQTNQSAESEL